MLHAVTMLESQVVDLMLSHFNNGRVGFDHLLCCSKRSRWQWVQCAFKWWVSGNHPRPVLWRLVGLPQLCAWRSVSLQEWWCAKDDRLPLFDPLHFVFAFPNEGLGWRLRRPQWVTIKSDLIVKVGQHLWPNVVQMQRRTKQIESAAEGN